jgi:2-keto-4-pentenoate hydratase
MIHDALVEETAARLLIAYDGSALESVSASFPPGDVAAAYAVQLAQVRRWRAQGRRFAGHKIGLTSKAVQAQLGVGEPDFGHLFSDMIFGDNEEIPYGRLQQPRVEAEIALILGRDLDQENCSVADVIGAVAYVLPSVEIVSSRIAGWRINIVDTIADNASSGLVALGGPARRLEGLDLSGCKMSLSVNGEVRSQGRGADCLGHPLNAAVWLARRSGALGAPLRAGDLILTGALGPMVAVAPGDRVEAQIEGLGGVAMTFSGGAS